MWLIFLLVLIGLLLLIAELIVLPGITLAGIGAILSFGVALYLVFLEFGVIGTSIALGVVLLLSLGAVLLSMRAKTWRKFSLKSTIEGVSQSTPQERQIKIGDCGLSLTRLAPMGKVELNGTIIEAKSLVSYIDQRREIEVIGFDNTSVIVKLKN